ncbi:MAG TPA: amino acid ABC transporter ATP-binding protein [Longimicrobiaceae bacterium]
MLKGISLDVRAGEALAIIGPSGSGKSTLLRCLSLLEPVTSGMVLYEGHPVTSGEPFKADLQAGRLEVGLVFQEFNLWPNKTVLQNLTEAPIYVLGSPRRDAERQGMEWLDRVGIADQARKFPAELSGGQRQRAAIARALMMNPRVLLMDEITSALDVETTAHMLHLLNSLREDDRTFVYVTHHLRFAERNTDRTAVLIDGRIVEVGESKTILRAPSTEDTSRFLSLVQQVW